MYDNTLPMSWFEMWSAAREVATSGTNEGSKKRARSLQVQLEQRLLDVCDVALDDASRAQREIVVNVDPVPAAPQATKEPDLLEFANTPGGRAVVELQQTPAATHTIAQISGTAGGASK